MRHDYLRSLRFLGRLERRDGEWRIAHRLVLSGGRTIEEKPLYLHGEETP